MYRAKHIDKLPDNCVVININKLYKRADSPEEIYNKVRGDWVIAKWRLPKIKFVLAEYKGLILNVFEVLKWDSVLSTYQSKSKGKTERIKYRFTKDSIEEDFKNKYIGKTIPVLNKRFPLMYPARTNKELINEEN